MSTPDLRALATQLLGAGIDGMGERLVRAALSLAGSESVRKDLTGFASTVTSISDAVASTYSSLPLANGAAGIARAFLVDLSLERLLTTLGLKDAAVRANLIVAYLGGMVATRYVVGMQPLAGMTDDEVVAVVAPTIQRLLDPRREIADL